MLEANGKLMNTKDMLVRARREGYAVPAFNIHNLETIQVVVETAERLKSPVILAATPGTVKYVGMKMLHDMVHSVASTSKIPIALHLDHSTDFDFLVDCLNNGFGSVMIDASHENYESNIKLSREAVVKAETFNASVEAELGRLGGREEHVEVSDVDSYYTDPLSAVAFVKETHIDSLAVAIGTAHGLYKEEPRLDLDRLKAISERISIPLVLHGASGVPEDTVKKCIELGIAKVNIATELKIAFASALKKTLLENPEADDPRVYFKEAKIEMAKVVEAKILMCGSANRVDS